MPNADWPTVGRRLLVLPVLGCLLGCGAGRSGAPVNVVLISIDCLNQRQFSAALESGAMPVSGQLARQSMVFTRAYAHAPWTTPSHMSMLTGLYPSQHGRDIPFRLMIELADSLGRAPGHRTLADILAAAGHETAAFVGKGSISARFGLGKGFRRFQETAKGDLGTDLGETRSQFLHWLENATPPFFAFVHTYDLHSPRPARLDRIDAALGYIDAQLAAILEGLRVLDLYDDSLIILTGDHGSKMIRNDRKCCIHGAGHYEENLKVPLVVKLPGSSDPVRRSDLVRHVDLLPTVLAVVGIDPATYAGPGSSILGSHDPGEERLSFSEADGRCFRRFGLVSRRYKYIYTPRDPMQTLLQNSPLFRDRFCGRARCARLPPVEELYDLQVDIFEERDLLLGEALGETETRALQRLREEMDRHLNLDRFYRRRIQTGELAPEERADDRELEKSLRALGYIQ